MGNPQHTILKLIEEVIGPRTTDHQSYLAVTVTDPVPVARTDLLYLWDEYHHEYLDYATLASPLGHRPAAVLNPVLEHGRYYGYTAPQGRHVLRWPVEYARDLSRAFSGPGETRKVLYCEGEREAVREAVRLASAGKPVLVLDTGHHDWLGTGTRLAPGERSGTDWSSYGALLLTVVDTQARPVPGVREAILCARTARLPVIIDETVTGFGRLGTLWGQEETGLVADLTVLGGPAGGGLPFGAIVGPADYFDGPLDVSPQAGHPWACAAGASLLKAIHPGLLEHVQESATALTTALDGLVGQFPDYLTGHQGRGLYRGLVFTDPVRARDFPQAVLAQGLHLAPAVGNTVLLAPVLVSSTHEVTRGVDLMAATLLSWEDN